MPGHPRRGHSWRVEPASREYAIRLGGHLGATALSAFPTMDAQVQGRDTVLTGPLRDRSAVFAVLAEIEALGLELIELRIVPPRNSPPSGDERSQARPEVAHPRTRR